MIFQTSTNYSYYYPNSYYNSSDGFSFNNETYDELYLNMILKKEVSISTVDEEQMIMKYVELITIRKILEKDLKKCTKGEILEQLMLLRL